VVEPRAAPGPLLVASLALRFALELAMLAALAVWGVHAGHSTAADVVLGVGAPAVAATLWGLFAAPRSGRRLSGRALTVVQLVLLGAGAAALVAARHTAAGIVFAALIVLNALTLAALGSDGRPPVSRP
jgi:Protein of unknown function (DUF2568)